MTYTDEQYSRVARALDGEAVILSDAEEALLADVLAEEASLDAALLTAPRAELPAELVAQTTHRPKSRHRKLAWLVACEVAAAILLLVSAAALFDHTGTIAARPNPVAGLADADTLDDNLFANGLEAEMDELAMELDLLEYEVLVATDASIPEDFNTWFDTPLLIEPTEN